MASSSDKTPKTLYVAVNPTKELVELAAERPAIVDYSKPKLVLSAAVLAFWAYLEYYVNDHNSGAVAWILGATVWFFIFAQFRAMVKACHTVQRQPRAQKFKSSESSGDIVRVDPAIVSATARALPASTKLTDKEWQQLMQRGADKVRYLQTNVLPVLLPTSGAQPRVRAEAERQLAQGVSDIINGGDELDIKSANVGYAIGLNMDPNELD